MVPRRAIFGVLWAVVACGRSDLLYFPTPDVVVAGGGGAGGSETGTGGATMVGGSTGTGAAAATGGTEIHAVIEYQIPSVRSQPRGIVAGPDGNLWFTEYNDDQIGRITLAGQIAEFPTLLGDSGPFGITTGPDGNLWFAEVLAHRVGYATPDGIITEFSLPPDFSLPKGVTVGPDGAVWFTGYLGDGIARITTAGIDTVLSCGVDGVWVGIAAGSDGCLWLTGNAIGSICRLSLDGNATLFDLPDTASQPWGIAEGPDGAMWFAEYGGSRIGRITPAGVIAEFSIPTPSSYPVEIVAGPDGNLWFTEDAGNNIGRITPAGVIAEYPIPTPRSGPAGIAVGPDSNIWFTEQVANKNRENQPVSRRTFVRSAGTAKSRRSLSMSHNLVSWSMILLISGVACGGKLSKSAEVDEPAKVTMVSETTGKNPFKNVRFFINPDYVEEVESTARKHPEHAATIRKVEAYPTAVWLDTIAEVSKLPHFLDAAKQQQRASGRPTLSVFVLCDLPNRDCAAKASAGELSVEANGEARYRSEFVDPIAAQFAARPDQPIVAIVEPDSLANLTTNMHEPKCAASAEAYRRSIVYAIKRLALPNVSVYLDAAHAGWLGWDGNRIKMVTIFKRVLQEAGGVDMIRGFATNVSNYTHLSNRDGAALALTNPCPNELTYAKMLAETLSMYGMPGKGFIIDTSRNGRGGIRHQWGNWCNIKGAGLGQRPRAEPIRGVDAYFWIKPPGESDGVSDPTQPRFDEMCANRDAAPDAPQAGKWFEAYFLDLIRNASPPL